MNSQWKRVLRLVRRTGDRLVVVNEASGDACVVMDLDQYEQLIDNAPASALVDSPAPVEETVDMVERQHVETSTTEEPVYEKVMQVEQEEAPDDGIWNVLQNAAEAADGPGWNMDDLTEQERTFLKEQYDAFKQGTDTPEAAPSSSEAAATNDPAQNPSASPEASAEMSATDDDDDFEEERFYLEPIE